MRLLLVAQTVDRTDAVFGFFHRWIEKLALHFERIEVICLREGEHTLPANVRVHSLGKEHRGNKLSYGFRFYALLGKLRGSYDAVLVHQNQEYLLLAGWLWKLSGKPVYFWANHFAGSFLTRLAALWCTKIFC